MKPIGSARYVCLILVRYATVLAMLALVASGPATTTMPQATPTKPQATNWNEGAIKFTTCK